MLDKTTALILPGAGARTRPQAGMLKAFHESGLKYDMAFGTSGGALNGFLYHQGDLGALLELWKRVTNEQVYKKAWWRIFYRDSYVFDSNPLATLIAEMINPKAIAANPKPLFINAFDSQRLRAVSMQIGGMVAEDQQLALLASAALPMLFPPVYLQNRRLVDGGMARNFPFSQALARGAKRIVALIPTAPSVPNYDGALHSMEAMIEGFEEGYWQMELDAVQAKRKEDPETELILIRPAINYSGGLLDFTMPPDQAEQIIESGYNLAKQVLAQYGLWQTQQAR